MTEKQKNSDFEINQNPNGLRNAIISIIVLFLLIVGTFLFVKIDISEEVYILVFYIILIASGFICYFICTGKIGNYNVFKRKFEEDIPALLQRRYVKYKLGDSIKAYLADGDYQKAIIELEASLSVHPTNVLIMLWMAELYEYIGHQDNATSSYKKAIQHSNSFVRIYFESQLKRLNTHGCKKPGMTGLRHMTW